MSSSSWKNNNILQWYLMHIANSFRHIMHHIPRGSSWIVGNIKKCNSPWSEAKFVYFKGSGWSIQSITITGNISKPDHKRFYLFLSNSIFNDGVGLVDDDTHIKESKNYILARRLKREQAFQTGEQTTYLTFIFTRAFYWCSWRSFESLKKVLSCGDETE